MKTEQKWQFWIDVGGTFTDCIGVDPLGKKHFAKVLSSGKLHGALKINHGQVCCQELRGFAPNFWLGKLALLTRRGGPPHLTARILRSDPDGLVELDQEVESGEYRLTVDSEMPSPVFAIRKILRRGAELPLPDLEIRLGTTRGTNALLTRTGAQVCLVTTHGFKDLLHIGFQNRPDLFALTVKKPQPLFVKSIEVAERVHFDGQVETELDRTQVQQQLLQVKRSGVDSLAVCLMHGYRFVEHEQLIAEIAREIGFAEISLSHQVAPEIRIIPRAYTTVLDAYLNPVLRNYLAEIRSFLSENTGLQLFTSAGSLVAADEFTGKDSILSGPAGGVIGFSKTAEQIGIQKTIGFDMGGTSTDVSRFDGEYQFQYESEKSGVLIVSPTLAIETVAAGGGSICRLDGHRLLVGPESAGADPGPACYGKGGPLCLSDINLFCNRINADSFPFPIDRSIVEQKLTEIQTALKDSGHGTKSLQWIANGFLKIAVAKTAEAIRLVSVQKGYDCQDYTLVGFGGAAGQIACPVADELKIQQVLIHPQASLLSAYGIGLADQTSHHSVGIYQSLDDCPDLNSVFEGLEWDACKNNSAATRPLIKRRLDVRYAGTETYLTIDFEDKHSILKSFQESHLRRFGYQQDRTLEIGSARIEVIDSASPGDAAAVAVQPYSTTTEFLAAESESSMIDRATLAPGDVIQGPCLICDPMSSTLVDHDWQAECLEDFQLLLTKQHPKPNPEVDPTTTTRVDVDEVEVELLNNQLFSIAEQMGETLRSTAVSVNVKERLDFSCAIFDQTGNLIANAPHIPIHLGAMSECVKCLIEDNSTIDPGDVFVTNDPYRGGSHLPDITVVSPCFDEHRCLRFWVASRAHHAEIGGKVPGSFPLDSRCLADEGVLIQNFRLVTQTTERFDALESLFRSGPFPSRQPETNISDIKAQVAANQMGLAALENITRQMDHTSLDQLIARIYEVSAEATRELMKRLEQRAFPFEDFMDCGAKIKLQILNRKDQLVFDFSGTSPVLDNNLNANRAIVQSAIIYCLRIIIGKEIPLNQGLLDPVKLVLPECFLNPTPADDPQHSPAIVGGNVETSQRIVDVILGALGVAAASQGTSNNVIFGNEKFGYYETVCGGGGATADGDGGDAIQVHITNTRITDPEVLESRYPVILDQFSIRQGSGGLGKHRGGNGVIRKMRFREPLRLTVLSNRYRDYRPYGIHGGKPGEPGTVKIDSAEDFATGFTLETPGGGGWGTPAAKIPNEDLNA